MDRSIFNLNCYLYYSKSTLKLKNLLVSGRYGFVRKVFCTEIEGRGGYYLFMFCPFKNNCIRNVIGADISKGFVPLRKPEHSKCINILCFCILAVDSLNLCPVGWGRRIHRLHLCRGVRLPSMRVPDMTLNNLMVRFQ